MREREGGGGGREVWFFLQSECLAEGWRLGAAATAGAAGSQLEQTEAYRERARVREKKRVRERRECVLSECAISPTD